MAKYNQATIKDVSIAANVSMSTVSHVINGTKFVSEETRKKVMDAIEQTGYTQNFLAKAFKTNRSMALGLIITDIRNQYFIDVIDAVYKAASARNYSVILANSQEDPKKELASVKSLYERRVDGIIMSPTADCAKYALPFLEENHIPTTFIDRRINSESDWVGCENINSTIRLTEHLIEQGHKKIMIVAGVKGINTTTERITGYKMALSQHNLPCPEHYIVYGESKSEPSKLIVSETLKQLKNDDNMPSAIIAASNLMVFGTMQALKELNLKVPDDISLAAFDDFEWSDLFEPHLTAVSQPCTEIGETAVELLLNRIDHPSVSYRNISLNPRLIIRDSSCPSKTPTI